jgi:DNA-binding XRE family transcriptional regulator
VSNHRLGRPRVAWVGKFGAFLASYRVDHLADQVEVDPASIYRWARGDSLPSVPKAIAIVEVARRSGRTLSLEDIFVREVTTSTDEGKRDGFLSSTAKENRTRRLGSPT